MELPKLQTAFSLFCCHTTNDTTPLFTMNADLVAIRSTLPEFLVQSTYPWLLLPQQTWTTMTEALLKAFPATTIATFIAHIYASVIKTVDEKKRFDRPPNGLIIKHLCIVFLHWLLTATPFEVYGHNGSLSTGLSKSYIKGGMMYVLPQSQCGLQENLVNSRKGHYSWGQRLSH
jgi:hypothetical protein